jgi:hypothetical protein
MHMQHVLPVLAALAQPVRAQQRSTSIVEHAAMEPASASLHLLVHNSFLQASAGRPVSRCLLVCLDLCSLHPAGSMSTVY